MRACILGGACLAVALLAAAPTVASEHHPYRFRASSYVSHHKRTSSYGHTRFRASSYPQIARQPRPRTRRSHAHGPILTRPAT